MNEAPALRIEGGLSVTPTASDFRAEIARRRIRVYELAAHVGLHPTRLSAALNERLPITPELAARIQLALQPGGVERRSDVGR